MVHENHPLFGDPAIDPNKRSCVQHADTKMRISGMLPCGLFSSTPGVWPRKEKTPLAGELLEPIATHPEHCVDEDVFCLQCDFSASMTPS